MLVDKARLDATYTHEASEAGHLYYIALDGRAPAPYAEQRHVQAILDIAPDGTLAGVELIDNMPPPPLRSTEGKEAGSMAAAINFAEAYVAGYEFDDGDGGFHTPTEAERLIMLDMINGLFSDDGFVAALTRSPE